MFKDKLGREIKTGQLIAVGSSYNCEVQLGKVVKITKRSVIFKLYTDIYKYDTALCKHILIEKVNINMLKKDPVSYWRGFTTMPERRILILR